MTVCDILWAVCGVVGAVCRAVCVWRARGGVHAVMIAQCAVVGAVRDVIRVCGTCLLYAACDCAMCVRGLLACAVLGYTRHDADVPLWWVGMVRVCARVCCVIVSGSAALAGICARCALGLQNVKNYGCVIRATCDARLGRALSALSRAQ